MEHDPQPCFAYLHYLIYDLLKSSCKDETKVKLNCWQKNRQSDAVFSIKVLFGKDFNIAGLAKTDQAPSPGRYGHAIFKNKHGLGHRCVAHFIKRVFPLFIYFFFFSKRPIPSARTYWRDCLSHPALEFLKFPQEKLEVMPSEGHLEYLAYYATTIIQLWISRRKWIDKLDLWVGLTHIWRGKVLLYLILIRICNYMALFKNIKHMDWRGFFKWK